MPQHPDYYIPVNWSPYQTNPIDHIEARSDRRMLITPDDKAVVIGQAMTGVKFTVRVEGGNLDEAEQNSALCYILNTLQVGFLREGSYQEWLAKVRLALGPQIPSNVSVDQPYRKFFDKGLAPEEVALLVLPAQIRVIKTLEQMNRG